MVALWLRSKMAAFDPYVEQPAGEHSVREHLDCNDEFPAAKFDPGLVRIVDGIFQELVHTCILVTPSVILG